MPIVDILPATRIVDLPPVDRWKGGGPIAMATWPFRKRLDIQTAYLDSNLTDFPLYVRINSDADIGAACRVDGFDIRFTAADGVTLLKYEREFFGVTAGAASGDFWVKTNLATAGTYIWCYYGNAAAADGADPENVWDANFKGIYHMNDLTTSTIKDSTGNSNDGTKKGANEPIEAAGHIGKGQSFDGVDDYIRTPMSSPGIPLSISMWAKCTYSNPSGLFDSRPGGVNCVRNYPAGNIEWWSDNPDLALSADANAWAYLTFIFTYASNRKIEWYKNGVYQSSAIGTNADALSWVNFTLGTINTTLTPYDGLLDEVRISSIARSAAWVKFEYANMAEADNELTWGIPEGCYSS